MCATNNSITFQKAPIASWFNYNVNTRGKIFLNFYISSTLRSTVYTIVPKIMHSRTTPNVLHVTIETKAGILFSFQNNITPNPPTRPFERKLEVSWNVKAVLSKHPHTTFLFASHFNIVLSKTSHFLSIHTHQHRPARISSNTILSSPSCLRHFYARNCTAPELCRNFEKAF